MAPPTTSIRVLRDNVPQQVFDAPLPAVQWGGRLLGRDDVDAALEALASEEQDFGTAFGNFRFRWDARLRDCGLKPVWQMDLPDTMPAIAPHDVFLLQGLEGLGHGRVTDAEIRGGLTQAGCTPVLIDLLFQIVQQTPLFYGNGRSHGIPSGRSSAVDRNHRIPHPQMSI